MTPDHLRRLSELATPGEWRVSNCTVFTLDETGTTNRFSMLVNGGWKFRPGTNWSPEDRTDEAELRANAELTAAAVNFVRSDLPQLLARITALEAALEPMMRVLERMTYSYGYPAADIASDLEIPRPTVLTILRFLEAMGIAQRHPFFGEDDGLIRGSGYSLTKQGDHLRRAQSALQSGSEVRGE